MCSGNLRLEVTLDKEVRTLCLLLYRPRPDIEVPSTLHSYRPKFEALSVRANAVRNYESSTLTTRLPSHR